MRPQLLDIRITVRPSASIVSRNAVVNIRFDYMKMPAHFCETCRTVMSPEYKRGRVSPVSGAGMPTLSSGPEQPG